MSEEAVTKATIFFLKRHGWNVLDYDFPGSGTGRNFRVGTQEDKKNKKRVIPDIIAYKNETILWFENKDKDTINDYKKIAFLYQENQQLFKQILQAYPDKSINKLFFMIAFSGESKYLRKALEYNVEGILQVVSPLPEPEIKILFDPSAIFVERNNKSI